MRLSILIPTHRRPELFKRCLESVIKQLPDDVQVVVNNDSADICEIDHPNVIYWYRQYDSLSEVYQFLLSRASGEYVYFLEDDDYLYDGFFDTKLDCDLICGNYLPTYKPSHILDYIGHYKNTMLTFDEFCNHMSLWHLQLSQFIFKRAHIESFDFVPDNNVHNDIRLALHAAKHAKTIKSVARTFFHQTVDGGDNISFSNSNSTLNISRSLEFLKDYGLQDTKTYTAGSRPHQCTLGQSDDMPT